MRHSPSPMMCEARGEACSPMQASAEPEVAPQGAGRRLPPGGHVPASLVTRSVSPSTGPSLYSRREPSWAQATWPRARHAVRRWNRGHDHAGRAALPCPHLSPGDLVAAVARLLGPGAYLMLPTPNDWSAAAMPMERWIVWHSQRGTTRWAAESLLSTLVTPDEPPSPSPGSPCLGKGRAFSGRSGCMRAAG